MKRVISMATAIALATAPALAAAASPAPAPVRASAVSEDSSDLAGGSWTLLIGLAIIAGVLVIALTGDDDILPDVPTSP